MSEKIRNQRTIIDRKELTLRLEALAAEGLTKAKRRTAVLALFKEAYQASHAEVRHRFEISGIGTEAVHEQAFLIDQLVRLAFDFANEHEFPADPEKGGAPLMSVVAVGGYGRGELSPHSDIDLLFLLPSKRSARAEQVVQYLLYLLWDIGLKVGHSTRTVDECLKQAKGDMTIRTALLEARWVWGDQALFDELKKRFRAEIVSGSGEEFVEAKLAERADRHARLGEARYVLEPNIKDGKGGLRDLHTLYWIAKYLYVINEV
jgi:[protein-PII] uridylyltransferase